MKSYRYFILILLLLITGTKTFATNIASDNREIETYIEVPVNGSEDVEKLISLGLSIEANIVRNKIAKGFISKGRILNLIEAGFDVTISDEVVTENPGDPAQQSFYTFETCRSQLLQWAGEYPDIYTLDTLGYSQKNKPIWVFHITGTPETTPKQRVYATGSTHGNEKIGTEIVMWMAKDLLTKYATDDKIKELVDRTQFTIHPIVNADGFISNSRRLANGDDPNRCGGIHVGTKGESYPYEHPELNVYRDVLIQGPVHLGLDYHCGLISMLIPFFASTVSLNLDNAEYTVVKKLYPPNYPVNEPDYFEIVYQNASGLTNSAPAAKYGTIALMPEVCNMNPSASSIEKIATHNYDCIKAVLDDMQKGVRGIITDAQTKAPLYARVTVNGKYAPTHSHHKSGGYFKYISNPSGSYEVTAYANGYKKETKTVDANPDSFAELDFELTPEPEQPFAVLSLDAILSFNNSMGQDELLNCLELNDGKSLEIVGNSNDDGYIDLDFGPNHFAIDAAGDDITVYATGDYKVSAGYIVDDIYKPENDLGQGSGTQSFDLGEINLDSARFIQISSSGSIQLDAVEAEPHEVTGTVDHFTSNKLQSTPPTVATLKGKTGAIITAYLPKGNYEITVYSINGQKVAEVSKGFIINNTVHSFLWNGRGNNNLLCAAGMYMFTITYTNGKETLTTPLVW